MRRKIYEFFSSLEYFIKFLANDFVEHEGQDLISNGIMVSRFVRC